MSPCTVNEVQSVIKAVRELNATHDEQKLRLRAVGTGHSWSPLFPDEGGIIVHVRKLKRPNGAQIELSEVGFIFMYVCSLH